jgi:4-hydroxythreonine-4-phosphate dehydrogenase
MSEAPARPANPGGSTIAVTCGDPAGVGPEIVAQLAIRPPSPGIRYAVFGPGGWLGLLPAAPHLERHAVGPESYRAEPGKPTVEGARVALAAMEEAAAGCRSGRFAAVVTGPVSKIWMQRAGYPFPGQSEFFADRWQGVPSMAFTGGRLRVVLATWHIPFRDVPGQLTQESVGRAVRRAEWLALAGGCPAARIAVCGLNPHAGEEGMLGTEERDVLDPWLDVLRERHPGVSRCLPSDTVFARALSGEFDVVVALYHDQGLAPLKTVDFDTAVNVTLGLRHIRTSPDHGTAFGIAGRGRADTRSFANAIAVAERLARYQADRPCPES